MALEEAASILWFTGQEGGAVLSRDGCHVAQWSVPASQLGSVSRVPNPIAHWIEWIICAAPLFYSANRALSLASR